MGTADHDSREFAESLNLKVFRYVSKNKRTVHLYAETSSGQKIPFCHFPIDITVGASQIKSLRGDECVRCKSRAEEVFQRKPTPPALGSIGGATNS
jgi:hypothetical protein